MESLPQLFEYEDKMVRVIVLDGQPWWVAKDICEVLNIKNHRDATSKLNASMKRDDVGVTDAIGRIQNTTLINESGVYKIAFTSQKPEAERFTNWVASEVLPSIRKHGIYVTEATIDNMLSDPDFGIRLLTTLKEEREARLQAEKTNNILMHVNKTYTATEIAKELGFKSAQEFNKDLSVRKIQFKQNNTWVLYSDYASRGYVEIKQEVMDSGRVIYHRRWTQLGREFLLRLYQEKVS